MTPDLVRPGASIAEFARAALSSQREIEALPLLQSEAVRNPCNARLWQWIALLHRGLGEYPEATEAMARGHRLAPTDASIAHGRAQLALESGIDAVDLFLAAQRLSPEDATIPLGLSAARVASGDAAAAVSGIDELLVERPQWIAGHQQLSQIRWMLGEKHGFAASFERALAIVPHDEE